MKDNYYPTFFFFSLPPFLPCPEMLEPISPVTEMGQGSPGSSVDAGEGRKVYQYVADKKIILFLTESRSIICFIF